MVFIEIHNDSIKALLGGVKKNLVFPVDATSHIDNPLS